jgi:hypothetical protein
MQDVATVDILILAHWALQDHAEKNPTCTALPKVPRHVSAVNTNLPAYPDVCG